MSSRSESSRSRRNDCFTSSSTICRAVASSSAEPRSRRVSANPMIDVSGVRSSWDTAARMFSRSTCSRWRSVTSCAVPTRRCSPVSSASTIPRPRTTRSVPSASTIVYVSSNGRPSRTARSIVSRTSSRSLGCTMAKNASVGGAPSGPGSRPKMRKSPRDQVARSLPTSHSQLPTLASSCASARLWAVRRRAASASSRSDSVAPRTSRLTATNASSPCRICTAVVASSPSGDWPETAPATAIAATTKLPVAAPR